MAEVSYETHYQEQRALDDEYGDAFLASPGVYDESHSHFQPHANPNLRSYSHILPSMQDSDNIYGDPYQLERHTISPQHLQDGEDGDNSGDYGAPAAFRSQGKRMPRGGAHKYLNVSTEVVKQQRADARRARNRLYAKECRARKKEHLGTLDQQLAEAQMEINQLKEEISTWKQIAQNRGALKDGVDPSKMNPFSEHNQDQDDSPVAFRTRRMSSTGASALNSPSGSSLMLSPMSTRSRRSSRRSIASD